MRWGLRRGWAAYPGEPRDPPAPRPDVVRALEQAGARLARGLVAGPARSEARSHGVETEEIRPYRTGDEARQVDWNVTARLGRLHVRESLDTRSRDIALVVDRSASLRSADDGGAARAALRMAAVLGSAALHAGHRVALLQVTDRVEDVLPPGAGRRHAREALACLTGFRATAKGTRLDTGLRMAERVLPRPGAVFVVSDFLQAAQAELEAALARVAARHETVAFVVRGKTAPVAGSLRVRDPESGEVRRAAWEEVCGRERIIRRLRELGAEVVDVPAGVPAEDLLLARWGRRAGRGR